MPRFLGRANHADVPVPAMLMTTCLSQVILVITLFSGDAFTFALDLTSALALIPYLLAAAYCVRHTRGPGRAEPGARRDLLVAALATLYTMFLLFAAGLKFVLVSFILYAPATVLFAMGRREQGRRIFSGPEAAVFAVSVAGAITGVIALTLGWIHL